MKTMHLQTWLTTKTFYCLLLLLIGSSVKAQKEANVQYDIYLDNVQYKHTENTKDKSVAGTISAIIDAAAAKNSVKEMDGYVPAVGTMVKRAVAGIPRLTVKEGAVPQTATDRDFLLSTEVTSIGINTSYKDKNMDEKAFVNMTITLKRLHTGEILGTQAFSGERNVSVLTTKDKAMTSAIDDMEGHVNKYLWAVFPVRGNVLEQAEVKKDKLKSLYIDLGNADGVYKGQYFTVMEIGTVAGHEVTKEIGRLKIESIQGEEVSECKVIKGNEAIKAAFDKGSKMIIKSSFYQGIFR